jgi:hypothetical protein
MRGLFLTYGTVTTEQGADEFLAYCQDEGITDAFVQTGIVGKGSIIDKVPDLFPYLVAHRVALRIHAHITTLLLWREKNYLEPALRPEIKDEWLHLNGRNKCWELDATNVEVQDYLVTKCKRIVREHDIQGIYLERLYYHPSCVGKGTDDEKRRALTTILERITRECREVDARLTISVATWLFDPATVQRLRDENPNALVDSERLQDVAAWEGIADYLMPLLFKSGDDFDALHDLIKDDPKYIPTLGCFHHTVAETQRQIALVGDCTLYAYHQMSGGA